jgi:hypothetical protein
LWEYSDRGIVREAIVTREEALESFPAEGPKLSANENEAVHISHIQLILAEKRTSLAVLRTGIVVLSLPLSVVTVLIATSRYYDFLDTYHLIVPLLGLCAGLVLLAAYLVQSSLRRIHNQDVLVN